MSRAAARDIVSRSSVVPREETSMFGFANILLRHRGIIAGTTLLATLIMVVSGLTERKSYTTRVLFTARGAKSGLLAQIANQYGLSIVGSDPGRSTKFYEELIRANEVLRAVANKEYQVRTKKGLLRGKLPVMYGIKAGSREAEIDLAALQLQSSISTGSTLRTGIVSYFVSSPYPELTMQLAENILTELNTYNIARQQAQATLERTFIEKRLAESRAGLTRAEDQLRSFRDANRDYGRSPVLRLENNRLDREVTMRQSLYTSLSQAYEQSRIEEVRDTPSITIIEHPTLPNSPDTTYGLRNTLLGAIGGLFLGIILAFVRERFNESKAEGSKAFADFSRLKRETFRDISRPWEPVGRVFRGGRTHEAVADARKSLR
jgi:uncharacterized protein involved in exopolysaccharide biosynthesis